MVPIPFDFNEEVKNFTLGLPHPAKDGMKSIGTIPKKPGAHNANLRSKGIIFQTTTAYLAARVLWFQLIVIPAINCYK
jgi:hypothetical protein